MHLGGGALGRRCNALLRFANLSASDVAGAASRRSLPRSPAFGFCTIILAGIRVSTRQNPDISLSPRASIIRPCDCPRSPWSTPLSIRIPCPTHSPPWQTQRPQCSRTTTTKVRARVPPAADSQIHGLGSACQHTSARTLRNYHSTAPSHSPVAHHSITLHISAARRARAHHAVLLRSLPFCCFRYQSLFPPQTPQDGTDDASPDGSLLGHPRRMHHCLLQLTISPHRRSQVPSGSCS